MARVKPNREERNRKRLELAAKEAILVRRARPECQGRAGLVRSCADVGIPNTTPSKPGSQLFHGNVPYAIAKEPKTRRIPGKGFLATKSIRAGSPKEWKE